MVQNNLILACLNNSEKAHKILYETTIPYVYSIVSRYITNPEERKDQTQEIYATVFKKIKSFDSQKGEFKYWLRKICVNQCLMHIRKHKGLSMLNIVELSEVNEPADVEIEYHSLSRNDIEKMLTKMPQGYKLVFMLNVIDGYNHTEIQDILGIKKDTSRSQLARAKKWIQKNMNNHKNSSAYGLF